MSKVLAELEKKTFFKLFQMYLMQNAFRIKDPGDAYLVGSYEKEIWCWMSVIHKTDLDIDEVADANLERQIRLCVEIWRNSGLPEDIFKCNDQKEMLKVILNDNYSD